MGQYYKACLITEDSIKVIRPDGWKMMEHSWYGNTAMKRIEKLLYKTPHRVIWVGDYSQCAPFVWTYQNEDEEHYGWEDKDKDEDLDLLEREDDKGYVLINNTRQEYINMTKQEHNPELFHGQWENVIHPLGLLCRADTEEAGGDYHSDINQDLLGIWCGDEIWISELTPEIEVALENYEDKTYIYTFCE